MFARPGSRRIQRSSPAVPRLRRSAGRCLARAANPAGRNRDPRTGPAYPACAAPHHPGGGRPARRARRASPAAAPQTPPSTSLACTITLTTDIRPGLTTQVRHQAVTTHGLTGTAACTGTVNGQPVTGPGLFGNTLQGVISCTQGSLTGTFVLKIPTAAGEQTITGRFAETVVAPFTAVFTGDLTGTVVSSVVLEGDCVTTPLTRSRSVIAVAVTT